MFITPSDSDNIHSSPAQPARKEPLVISPDPEKVQISFEIFPPKSPAAAKRLSTTLKKLARWQPHYISVTCGAGGSAHVGTMETIRHISEHYTIAAVPHITFWGQNKSALHQTLLAYRALGIRQTLALRGDIANVAVPDSSGDVYENTVDFVSDLHHQFGFEVMVAAYPDIHPLAQSPQQDLDHLKNKVAHGASCAVTQFFFEAETFLHFRDRAKASGIDVPLIPGIMPVHNLAQILKFARTCGTAIPSKFVQRFERWAHDEAALFCEGVSHALDLCNRLRHEGVRDFHFYTLNRSEMTDSICSGLGLSIETNSLKT